MHILTQDHRANMRRKEYKTNRKTNERGKLLIREGRKTKQTLKVFSSFCKSFPHLLCASAPYKTNSILLLSSARLKVFHMS